MRKKRWMLLLLVVMLIVPSFLANAESEDSKKVQQEVQQQGEYSAKDEVVYATLEADGKLQQIYVVNTFEVTKEGMITDYGTYETIKNLTDLSKIEQDGERIRFSAQEGKYYYQGNMNGNFELPWQFAITYELDGQPIQPEELIGKDGHVKIAVETNQNSENHTIFFENYMLQISVTLPETFTNIEVENGMIANAGKSKQVTFTVLPGQDDELSIEADVTDFSMQGIDIAAIPSSLSFEIPETEKMRDEMVTLADAIKKLRDGVKELSGGVADLNSGVAQLASGSNQFNDGLAEVAKNSTNITEASRSIAEGLNAFSGNMNITEEGDSPDLNELPKHLTEIGDGLMEAANGIVVLKDNYAVLYNTLDEAIQGIPEGTISNEEIASLYASGANRAVIDKLVQTYEAAQVVKHTYAELRDGFAAIEPALVEYAVSIREVGRTLKSMAEELSKQLQMMDTSNLIQLQQGLADLATNYQQFHQGLLSYTQGVEQLSGSYNEIHNGLTELSAGTNQLESGAKQLESGTEELYQKTSDMPDKMQDEIDEMMADFSKSDFQPVSFVSDNNEKINMVQFVIKTKALEKNEKHEEINIEDEKKGFWELFIELFRKN